jgi:hypothetical protein
MKGDTLPVSNSPFDPDARKHLWHARLMKDLIAAEADVGSDAVLSLLLRFSDVYALIVELETKDRAV